MFPLACRHRNVDMAFAMWTSNTIVYFYMSFSLFSPLVRMLHIRFTVRKKNKCYMQCNVMHDCLYHSIVLAPLATIHAYHHWEKATDGGKYVHSGKKFNTNHSSALCSFPFKLRSHSVVIAHIEIFSKCSRSATIAYCQLINIMILHFQHPFWRSLTIVVHMRLDARSLEHLRSCTYSISFYFSSLTVFVGLSHFFLFSMHIQYE